jgi:hypothetical protein
MRKMRMKTCLIFYIACSVNIYSQGNGHPLTYDDFDTLDVNNILLVTSNIGNCDGARWLELSPNNLQGYGDRIIYDHGPWLVGKVNGEPILSIIQWWKAWNYSPGPIIDGQAAMLIHPEDSLKYRTYKITQGDDDTNPDYAEWPVEYGAPVKQNGDPLIKGYQTIWSAYNSFDTTASIFGGLWDGPLTSYPIEIHQTVFAKNGFESDSGNIFSNVSFLEWEIINKSDETIDSAYFGFWSDIDFNGVAYNEPGVDTLRKLGYCWSESENIWDSLYPAVGYTLIFGPSVPSAGNTAIFKGRRLPDYKNLPLNTFRGIADDSLWDDSLHAPVFSMLESQNVAKGLTSNGYTIINPINNQPTSFPFSGDPVTGKGWIYDFWTSGGAGFVFFSGPFTMAPSDTQWAMIAVVPGLGTDRLNSITQMRKKAEILRSLPYDSLAFGTLSYPITNAESEEEPIVTKFKLEQNYPNPFNPSTKIKFTIPSVTLRQAQSDNWVVLKVYDVLGNEVATIVNKELSAGEYEVEFSAKGGSASGGNAFGLSSGIYFYTLRAGEFIQTKKMILIK